MGSYLFDVSIILVNYNTTKLLTQAITSIYEKSYGFSYEIIVVDNHSIESPKQVLTDLFGSGIHLLLLPENIGFGRANNEGIKIAKGRHIFLLNTDAYLVNNAIFILMNYMDKHQEVGSCGGNLYTVDLKPTYSYHRIPCGILADEMSVLTLGLSRRIIPCMFHNTSNKPLTVGNISGANMMLRHKVLDEVGLFDSDFFMYGEDTELSWRIKKAGYKNVNVPQAHIVHLEGKSSVMKESQRIMQLQGRKKYYVKVYGKVYFELANWLLLLGWTLKKYAYIVLGNKPKAYECQQIKELVFKTYYKSI